jgi:hemerythrin
LAEWQESLSIGVLEIDAQHKLLFEKFDAFLEACHAEAEVDTVHRLFWFLEAYTVTHFNDEEKLMQRCAYPDYLPHRREHQAFASEIGRIKETLKTEGPNQRLVSGITKLVSEWLINHISGMDRAIGHFISESGRGSDR